MMKTIIISGWPAVGKTHLVETNPHWADSDSSKFSWLKDERGQNVLDGEGMKIRNPNFKDDYLAHIHELIGNVPVIFVSTHKDTRDLLIENKLPFTLVYPERGLKDEYKQRMINRNGPAEAQIISFVIGNWEMLMDQVEAQEGCEKIVLSSGQYLSDVIDRILKPGDPQPRGYGGGGVMHRYGRGGGTSDIWFLSSALTPSVALTRATSPLTGTAGRFVRQNAEGEENL